MGITGESLDNRPKHFCKIINTLVSNNLISLHMKNISHSSILFARMMLVGMLIL